MIINARVSLKPRKKRICEMCRTAIEGKQIRLFGMAERGDKPYGIYLHPESCTSKDVKKALQKVKP